MRSCAWLITVLGGLGPFALRAAETANSPPIPAIKKQSTTDSQTDKSSPKDVSAKSESFPKELFRGKVVILREALTRRGIKSAEEFDKQVVLETPDGELIPIVPDWRGRAFYQDEKLRNRKVELIGVRRPGVPYLQVLMIFTFDELGVRQYTDYWCDICSIPMYEIKQCECCQGPIHLRFQPRDLPDYIQQKPLKEDASPMPASRSSSNKQP